MKRTVVSVLVALLLVISMTMSSFAAVADYVSLGDSNAYGSGLATEGYPAPPNYYTLVSNYLDLKKGYTSENLADDGKTTTTLMADLTKDNLEGAKVITISIGGNHLLGPILQAIYAEYPEIDPDLPGDEKMAALAEAIADNPSRFEIVKLGMMNSMQPGGELYKELQKSIKLFLKEWPLIMKEINRYAPKARVYVLTIYNPVLKDRKLGMLFAGLVLPINTAIRLTPLKYKNVTVIDTAVLFALNPRALSLDLSANPMTPETIDPHPTKTGHKIIADSIIFIDRLKK